MRLKRDCKCDTSQRVNAEHSKPSAAIRVGGLYGWGAFGSYPGRIAEAGAESYHPNLPGNRKVGSARIRSINCGIGCEDAAFIFR